MSDGKSPPDLRPVPHGRGSGLEPPNRFGTIRAIPDYADFENDPEFLEGLRRVSTQFLNDEAQSIVSENDSPDIPFRFSVNPYRGCEHGCSYWYARPESLHAENRTVLLISAWRRPSPDHSWPRIVAWAFCPCHRRTG